MGSYGNQAINFLISTLFGLYISIVMVRFILQYVRADFHNPVSQFIVKITHPVLAPMRRVIPAIGKADTAAVVLMVGLQLGELVLISALSGRMPNIAGLAVLSLAELIKLAIYVFMFSMIISAVMSWVQQPGTVNPIAGLTQQISEPVVAPFRKILPPMGGMDFSILFGIIALQLALILIVGPIKGLAVSLL